MSIREGAAGRVHPGHVYDALKASTRDLVRAAGGPRHCAVLTRGHESLISRYGARQEAVYMPLDVIADLEHDLGEPIITRHLAELSGHALARTANPDIEGSTTWLRHLSRIIEGGGDVSAGLLRALDDHRITKGEAMAEKERAIRLREDLTAYIASLDVIISGASR